MKYFLRRLGLFVLLFMSVLTGTKAQDINGLKTGKLSNGLTYYILHSNLQPGLASFYLVQKVGGIVEDDSQNGLAHFLEHMCFEGSTHFPDGVMNYLKSQNVSKFNAYTGTDETVYNIDDVSTKPFLVDTCMYLLRDWCGNLLLRDKEISQERGVITEEWRTRHDLNKHRQDAIAPYIFNHSKYATHDVIGDLNIIQHFKRQTLVDFYQKWYRPDLQGVIIVGDIDPDLIESKVKNIFGDLTVPKNAPARPYYEISDNDEPYYAVFKNDQVQRNSTTIYSREKIEKLENAQDNRKLAQMHTLFNNLAEQRLVEFRNTNEGHFFTADISYSKLINDYYLTSLSSIPFPGKDKEAMQEILTVFEQIKRYGFTEEEVEKEKNTLYQQFDQIAKGKESFKNSIYVNKLKANFLDKTPISTIDDGIQNTMEALLELDAAQLNTWVKHLDIHKNMLIECDAHDENTSTLTKEQVLQICKDVEASDVKKKVVQSNDTVFMDFKVPAGKIVSVEPLPKFDAEIWHLSNGAKVIYKNVPEGHGKFAFSANSFGGQSLLKPSEIPSGSAMTTLATRSGIYKHDKNTMNSMLRGKNMALQLNFTETQEGISGGAPIENSELFFQVIYLFLTHPRFEKADFDSYIQRSKYKLETTPKTPFDLVSDSIRDLGLVKNDRTWNFDDKFIDAMNFDTMKRLFKERYSNSADFNYYIVGDIDKEKAKDLVCQYIASLPSTKAPKETFVDYDFASKNPKIVKKYTIVMPDKKAMVDISYLNRLKLTDKEKLAFDIMAEALRNRYFEKVREEQGGTYGVNVTPSTSDFPHYRQQLNISFQTESGREDALKPLIYKELKDVESNGLLDFEIKEAVTKMKTNRERDLEHKTVPYWMNTLVVFEERGVNTTDPSHFENIIDTITAADIQALAKRFFDTAKLRDIVIVSKGEQASHYLH